MRIQGRGLSGLRGTSATGQDITGSMLRFCLFSQHQHTQHYSSQHQLPRSGQSKGFTLVELLIVTVLVAVLLSLAVPSFQDFIERSKLRSGTTGLSALRGLVEQAYQDNRSYRKPDGTCYVTHTTEHFTLTCAASSNTAYTLTATSMANEGLGSAGDYVYTINEDGARKTTKFNGAAIAESVDWKYR